MNTVKPIEKWKFDLQIIIAIILILLYFTRGVLFVLYDKDNTTMNSINSNIWYITTILTLIMLGFKVRLFQAVETIKKIIIACLIIYILGVAFSLVNRLIPLELNLFKIVRTISGFFEIGSVILHLVLFINILREKFKNVLIIKLLRVYAIVSICTIVCHYLWYGVLYLISLLSLLNPSFLNWQWGLEYFILIIPIIFLIKAYHDMKLIL